MKAIRGQMGNVVRDAGVGRGVEKASKMGETLRRSQPIVGVEGKENEKCRESSGKKKGNRIGKRKKKQKERRGKQRRSKCR